MIQLGELIMILDLHRQGLSVSAIARRVGIDRKTVRKYIERGLEPPSYGPRKPRARRLEPFEAYLRQRVVAYPGLTASRLLREIREHGYGGGYSAVTDFLREVRPSPTAPFEVRFETPPGEQAQVDFAHFEVIYADEPEAVRKVWLFSLVLGYSRLIWARFVAHQDLQTVLRCHMAAFGSLGGVPREILYDRMKTAVIGEDDQAHIVYNRALIDFARHYGFHPKACRPYRAKTKGKVERPFRYIREDFYLARSFRNLDDLNAQLAHWLGTVANPRVHATTRRVVNEAFAEEKLVLQPLPLVPFRAVLKLERRVSHEGMVSVGGNFYSVPDATRKRVVEVHSLADEIRVFEADRLIAVHPVLEGRHQRRLAPGHRKMPTQRATAEGAEIPIGRAGDVVARRSLDFYDAVARRLAAESRQP
ncbi:MAG: IS21 family transposase [Pseudomonadota bacterium]|nr:IS21 family transposase [Pseudomonadota bacterium]